MFLKHWGWGTSKLTPHCTSPPPLSLSVWVVKVIKNPLYFQYLTNRVAPGVDGLENQGNGLLSASSLHSHTHFTARSFLASCCPCRLPFSQGKGSACCACWPLPPLSLAPPWSPRRCVPRSAWLHVEQVVRGAKRVQKPLGGMKCGRGCPWPQKRPFPECASRQLQAQGPSGGWVPSDPAASSCMGSPSPQADP